MSNWSLTTRRSRRRWPPALPLDRRFGLCRRQRAPGSHDPGQLAGALVDLHYVSEPPEARARPIALQMHEAAGDSRPAVEHQAHLLLVVLHEVGEVA